VEDERPSYRETVRPGGRAKTYQSAPGAPPLEERGLLDHSTLWRTLTWLGSQLPALLRGQQLLLQQHPAALCHRFLGAVAPGKSRSPQREQILRQTRRLLHLIAEWDHHFPERFFPRFATRAGFG
jgi:hypothetical protein